MGVLFLHRRRLKLRRSYVSSRAYKNPAEVSDTAEPPRHITSNDDKFVGTKIQVRCGGIHRREWGENGVRARLKGDGAGVKRGYIPVRRWIGWGGNAASYLRDCYCYHQGTGVSLSIYQYTDTAPYEALFCLL